MMMKSISAEWKKMWFPKSSRLYLILATISSILTGLLFALTTQVTQDRSLFELEPMSIIEVNMLGVDVVTILLLLFVAIQIGREFQGKTIQSYLAATPARSRYFIAKALMFCLVSLVVGIIVALVTHFNGQLLVSAVHKQMPALSEVWQFAAGSIVMPPFYVLLTVCATFYARNTATGIVMPLIVLFLPAIAELFPKMLQNMVIPVLPASAIHTLSGMAQKGSIEYTGILTAFVTLGFWVLLSAASAIWRFCKKDI